MTAGQAELIDALYDAHDRTGHTIHDLLDSSTATVADKAAIANHLLLSDASWDDDDASWDDDTDGM